MPRPRLGPNQDQRSRFGVELRAVLDAQGVSQVHLAKRLGGLAQSTVSAWLSGHAVPGPHAVFRIEETLDLPGGTLSQRLGYLPVKGLLVETALAADSALTAEQRATLLAQYRSYVSRTK